MENVVYPNREIFGQYTIDWGAHKGGINGSNVPIEALSRMKFEAYAKDDDVDDDDDGDDVDGMVLTILHTGAPESKPFIR